MHSWLYATKKIPEVYNLRISAKEVLKENCVNYDAKHEKLSNFFPGSFWHSCD